VGIWAGSPRPSYEIIWYDTTGFPIAGAPSGPTHTVGSAQIGLKIFAGVTAANSAGSDIEFSNQIGLIT
jgi:hypothetical protein